LDSKIKLIWLAEQNSACFRLVSRHAHDSDAGNLARDVEAEQKAGRITALEYIERRIRRIIIACCWSIETRKMEDG
jgi:hypothetical protein